jgi:hypothetical protein
VIDRIIPYVAKKIRIPAVEANEIQRDESSTRRIKPPRIVVVQPARRVIPHPRELDRVAVRRIALRYQIAKDPVINMVNDRPRVVNDVPDRAETIGKVPRHRAA